LSRVCRGLTFSFTQLTGVTLDDGPAAPETHLCLGRADDPSGVLGGETEDGICQ